MATNLQIANQALSELGSATITQAQLDTPTTTPATIVEPVLVPIIKEVLSTYDFPFLRDVQALTAEVTAPTDTEFDYKFDATAITDLGAIRKITTTEGFRYANYRLEGTEILANDSTIYVHYTKVISDASTAPEYVVPAIVYRLAARLAKPLTGEISEQDRYLDLYERAMSRAMRRASQESQPKKLIHEGNSCFIEAHQGDTVTEFSDPYFG